MQFALSKRSQARFASIVIGLIGVALGCSDPAGPTACQQAGAIALEARNCLVFEDGGRLNGQRAAIEQAVRETLVAVRRLLPVTGVGIRISIGPATIIPEIGIGGRTSGTDEVRMAIDPEHPLLSQAVNSALFPLLAHEFHHIARHRQFGFSANLLEAMVLEGLADHFSVEVAGIDPPIWATALTPDEIEHWLELARSAWLAASWDHVGWFFGGDSTIPRWAGYTIGFELVERFLQAHPGSRASQLAGEPATTFLPVGVMQTGVRPKVW